MANIAQEAGVSPHDPRPHIQSVLQDVVNDSKNMRKEYA